jgi:hypothetical protein
MAVTHYVRPRQVREHPTGPWNQAYQEVRSHGPDNEQSPDEVRIEWKHSDVASCLLLTIGPDGLSCPGFLHATSRKALKG